jgi:hypothetical protein
MLNVIIGILYIATNLDDTKECDALESNKIVVGCDFARNIPNTTFWAC